MALLWVALFVAAASIALNVAVQKTYVVHSTGVVVVTGASTGIGRHFVETFAAKYANMTVLAGVRKESDAASIRAVGLANLQPWVVDVTSESSCAEAAEAVKKLLSEKSLPLVALVNNAGTSQNFPIEYHEMSALKSLYEINVFGMVRMTQLLLPTLRRDQGRVVQISSLNGRIATPRSGAYASTKFAMEAISDSLRREVAPFGVSVSVVEPAYVKSAIFSKVAEAAQKFDSEHSSESAQSKEVYAHLFTEKKLAAKRKDLTLADEPTVTTRVIEDAIVSATPQTRYVVANVGGVPAAVLNWIVWLVPDRVADVMLA